MTHVNKIFNLVVFMMLIFLLNSCSKEGSEKINLSEDQNLEVAEIPAEDISEKDEDLLTVDYKVFYDELAPHGEWIEVTGKELGLDLKKESGSGAINNSNQRRISLSKLLGINDAYAAEFEFGSFFVWKPSSNLAISASAGDAPAYTPYSNGQWMYTSYGWYFKAPTPHEEIVHHYGRWVHSPAIGWAWVPGRVWSPAWVEWREDDVNIAWSPIPPSVYIVAGEIPVVPVYEENYVIVEKRYFVEPVVYNYFYTDKEYKKLLKSMRRPKGVVVVNNIIMNQGPAVLEIERYRGSNIGIVKVHKVYDARDVQFTGTEINVFSPKFRKVKAKQNLTYNHFQPKQYTKYDETSLRNEEQRRIESASKKNNANKNFNNRNDNSDKEKNINKGSFEKKNKNENFKNDDKGSKKREINKNNEGNQKRNKESVKQNKKSRGNNSDVNQKKRQEKKQERKNDGKKKRSYNDEDESNYDFKIKHGLT